MNTRRILRALVLLCSSSLCAELIPAARLGDWQAGVNVGVTGGIPTRTVTSTITAPTDGSDASVAIQAALDAATAGDCLYLPAGNYTVAHGFGIKNGVVLRGAGMGLTNLLCTHAEQPAVALAASNTEGQGAVGGLFDDSSWTSAQNISGTMTVGTSTITVGSAAGFSVGDVVNITESNNRLLPVLDVTLTQKRLRQQKSVVTDKTSTTLTISPPLLWTLTSGLTPQVKPMTTRFDDTGLEKLTINIQSGSGAAGNGAGIGILMRQCVNSWLYEVEVKNYYNYGVFITSCARSEIRRCKIMNRVNRGSNGGAIVPEFSTGLLVEDNIIVGSFPHLEVNFANSNMVFAYNYTEDSTSGDHLGAGIDTNHGPHPHHNLYEGNVITKFTSDSYFGSVSDDTIFRNWIHGVSTGATQHRVALHLTRFVRNYSVVSNILGDPNVASNYYKAPVTGYSYNDVVMMTLGYPYLGGPGFDGTAQMSQGNWWAQWQGQEYTPVGTGNYDAGDAYIFTPTLISVVVYGGATYFAQNAAKSGLTTWITPSAQPNADWLLAGANGWPEIDLDVSQTNDDGTNPYNGTTILKANYNYNTDSIPASEVTVDAIPDSLFRSSKPSWFGSIAWPVHSTSGTPAPDGTEIPAGWRYINGNENYLSSGGSPRYSVGKLRFRRR